MTRLQAFLSLLFLLFINVMMPVYASGITGITNDQLRAALQMPFWLFVVMLMASGVNMLKQVTDAKRNGSDATMGAYISHWPETTATILGNIIAFLVLVVTNQLNFAAALGVGYGVNSAVDMLRSGGRSASLAAPSASKES